jgi:TRAP-type C4-dicarboxylate transport system permease small subunit
MCGQGGIKHLPSDTFNGGLFLMKKTVDRFFHIVAEISGNATVFFMLGIVITVTTQVLARHFLAIPTPWTEELARYFMIWTCFIGSVRVLIQHDHMVVDFLSSKYKGQVRKYAYLVIYLIELVFFAFLFYYGVKLCMQPVVINSRTSALNISRIFVYICMPISMFFNSLYALYCVALTVRTIICPSCSDDYNLSVGHNEATPSNEEETILCNNDNKEVTIP